MGARGRRDGRECYRCIESLIQRGKRMYGSTQTPLTTEYLCNRVEWSARMALGPDMLAAAPPLGRYLAIIHITAVLTVCPHDETLCMETPKHSYDL
jgi:hypothetical protein